MPGELVKATVDSRMMDHWASQKLIDLAAGPKGSEKTRERLRREMNDVAADLAGPDPSPAVRMLAESAAVAWFALRFHEANYAAASSSERGLSAKQTDSYERSIARAHRRLLSTLKTLATVRRLALPAVQVNIGAQQVNQLVAGTADPR